MVSRGGATSVRWRGDGKELFYVTPDGVVTAVEVSANGASFQPGEPKPLFKANPVLRIFWDVSSDGKRFLFPGPASDTPAPVANQPFNVILNWTALLRK